MTTTVDFDVVIAGGGPAGLQAALLLGRARRRVLLCDSGTPRNAPVEVMHGFLSRDGSSPAELRRIAREQLAEYPSVSLVDQAVTAPQRAESAFAVRLADGREISGRRLLLAGGLVDELPAIDGLADRWGRSVFNCPYCDGWEVRDQPLAVLGNGPAALRLALQLTSWSRDLVLCTNGPAALDQRLRPRLAELRIAVREEPIVRLEGSGDSLERIVFAAGPPLARTAAFLHQGTRQQTDLIRQLGCTLGDDGLILINEFAQTNVPGVYAAGDAARRASQPVGVAQVLVAAAAGAIAALAIDIELRSQDLGINLMAIGAPSPAAGTTAAR